MTKPKKPRSKKPALKVTPRGRVISALRRLWFFSPERQMAIKDCTITAGYVRCYVCNVDVAKGDSKGWAVDHVLPCVPESGWDSLDGFFTRLFTGKQLVICTGCHTKKTAIEAKARKMGKSREKL